MDICGHKAFSVGPGLYKKGHAQRAAMPNQAQKYSMPDRSDWKLGYDPGSDSNWINS